jgi:hypothetical protein
MREGRSLLLPPFKPVGGKIKIKRGEKKCKSVLSLIGTLYILPQRKKEKKADVVYIDRRFLLY